MKILILLSILISFRLYASPCNEYNLLETHHLLSEMDVKNQGSFSTCYAHSLSALYESKTGTSLHPYSIAFEHKKRLLHWSPYNLNYSLASFAWSDVRKKGVCESSEVSKRIDSFRTNLLYNDDQTIFAIKAFYPSKDIKKAINALTKEPFLDGVKWSDSDLRKLFTLLSEYPQKKFFDFLEEVILKDCHKIFPKLDLESSGLGFQSNKTLQDAYEKNLNTGEASVAGYCSHHMQEADYHNVKPRALLSVMPSCGAHYVLIVGQKEIDNKCQILIRNSHSDKFWARDNETCLCKNQNGLRLCKKDNYDINLDSIVGCYYDRELFLNETFDISGLR